MRPLHCGRGDILLIVKLIILFYVILSGTKWSRNISNDEISPLRYTSVEMTDRVRVNDKMKYVILSVAFCHLDRSGEV